MTETDDHNKNTTQDITMNRWMHTITTSLPPSAAPAPPNAIVAVPIPVAAALLAMQHEQNRLNMHKQYEICIEAINVSVAKYLAIINSAMYMIREEGVGLPADMPKLPTDLVEMLELWLKSYPTYDLSQPIFGDFTAHLRCVAQKAANDFELWYVRYALRYTVDLYNKCKKEGV
jgi:hypothetical protein